jgi:hypothetical protein
MLNVIDSMLSVAQYIELTNQEVYFPAAILNLTTIDKPWFLDLLKKHKISQRQLSKKMDLDPAAISYVLSGKRRITLDEVRLMAEILLVPVSEIMRHAGVEVMDDVKKVPIAGFVGKDGLVNLLPSGTHDTVLAPSAVPPNTFALQVRLIHHSHDGWLSFVSGTQQPPNDLLDQLCLVALTDGRMLQAIISKGYKADLYNLIPHPDWGVLENQQVAWCAKVLWILPQ